MPIHSAAGIGPFTYLVDVMSLTHFPLSSTVVTTQTATMNRS